VNTQNALRMAFTKLTNDIKLENVAMVTQPGTCYSIGVMGPILLVNILLDEQNINYAGSKRQYRSSDVVNRRPFHHQQRKDRIL
jgi:hypothetical protein